ncbi:MAG: nitroreductase family deazaflavin-dependent oxidoreductase [Anaerolineae bacterium]|nr:nitroreductase family deazaflavin-dependent oxidoreductase [Anaerolineae bacterium]
MRRKISAWQNAFQRVAILRPVTLVLATILHHADIILLRLSNGRLNFTAIMGLPVIELITIGAKSGIRRTLPLAGYPDGEKYILIASNFGRSKHPAWYHNLMTNSECFVNNKGLSGTFIAREAVGQERTQYWEFASSYYLGYQVYQQRAAHRKIPVMVLEPKR